ncbi:DitN-like 3-hydroxyacyl-CoA dehydrogenase,possibly related to diterpenoid metabolism (plasmid) [Aromatoleum aromaticum EbN1]|uniref:DitN-like 3-hydroxyacyl-CoA dehydrogenase,possibly related to diterpenoid metabolism n=2 Tax=Aromatoleum aromaticum TaxID=551760 RepID=Q5NW50_AROAE|nr:DitN-like 3-hydroxyacyl-CoA dehydrogenase,possibly related to diterpenoid metabolism [Aromatoleum aromaticum EbN1]
MSQMEKIIVVGAGLMGTGIAYSCAISGYRILLVDANPSALDKAVGQINSLVAAGVKLGKLVEAAGKAALERLEAAIELDGRASDAALLIETATEKIDIKLAIIGKADELLPPEAIIASNTSALSISELAAATRRPTQFAGMHFFNPVHKMKLVELIRGIETTQATVERLKAVTAALGKTSIVVNEAPGFTTSRMSALMGNEAMYMLAEGVASADDIDTSLRMAFNHPMGPLELGDLTGWDTRLSVLQYLHQTMGEKFRPCPLIIKMVKAGRYGRKVGRGVYEYDAEGQKIAGSGLRRAG